MLAAMLGLPLLQAIAGDCSIVRRHVMSVVTCCLHPKPASSAFRHTIGCMCKVVSSLKSCEYVAQAAITMDYVPKHARGKWNRCATRAGC